MKPIIWTKDKCSPALPITRQQLIDIGISADSIDKGEHRGEIETFGPWQRPLSYRALAMQKDFGEYSSVESAIAYGIRTMINLKEAGYAMDGWVSIQGKKRSAFTSSQMFELEDGKLVDVAIIFVRH